MIGRTSKELDNLVLAGRMGSGCCDPYYVGPYQSVTFTVAPDRTTIEVYQGYGYMNEDRLVKNNYLMDKGKTFTFDWEGRNKALECITAWVLDNSSQYVFDKILPPSERKPAPAVKLVPPAAAARNSF
jgi:hypothetical protein